MVRRWSIPSDPVAGVEEDDPAICPLSVRSSALGQRRSVERAVPLESRRRRRSLGGGGRRGGGASRRHSAPSQIGFRDVGGVRRYG